MKKLLIIFLLLTSCKSNKYPIEEEEHTLFLQGKLKTNDYPPCINRMYCNSNFARLYPNYYDLDVFYIKDIESDFKYYRFCHTDSVFELMSFEIILDTLQYHCPVH